MTATDADRPLPALPGKMPATWPTARERGRKGRDRLRRLSRSMLMQTFLIAGLFIAGTVYFLAVRPVMDFYPGLAPQDPQQMTLDAVRNAIWQNMTSGRSPSTITRDIANNPVVREVTKNNPTFRYSVMLENTVIGPDRPRYFAALGLDRISQARAGNADACAQMERPIRSREGLGYIGYFDCGKLQYYELYGIRQPIDLPQPPLWEVYAELVWKYSQPFIGPLLGAFTVFLVILIFHIVMIRRVARLIRPWQEDGEVGRLSERGLPTEVLPLVSAMNRMVSHVADVDQRQRFFLSAAAHEMRTPLTVLRTRLEMMEDQELKDKLVADVRRLTKLVNELLTLMSIRASERRPAEIDLVQCCSRAIAALEPIARAKGVALRLDGHPVRIVGDGALIEVAITNLIDNALAFSPEGGVVVVRTEAAGLAVADQGPGVAEDQIATLFEPFVRFTNKPGGYGLGLTILKAVADLHDAVVEVANAPDGGAIFVLRFEEPVSRAD